jgi:hypothetical protein
MVTRPLMFAISKSILYNNPGILAKDKKRPTTSPKIKHAGFLLNYGGLKLKNASDFKEHTIFLIALLLACTMFFASCSGDTSSNSSPTSPTSNTQASAITPIGALATCLTVNSPSLVKLADGNYQIVVKIVNCGGKDASPLQITSQIDTQSTKQNTNLMGPATLAAHRAAMYHSFTGQTAGTNKEIHFSPPASPSAVVTVLVTINGTLQGEWDGQLTIPA